MSDRRFDDFYVFDSPRLVAAVRLITGSADAARDAVDEACARAWERVEHGEDIEVLGAWVRVVAINLARGGLRRRVSERRAVERLTATAERNAAEPYGARETAIDVHRLLAALPRRQREVVVLHYLLDESVADIAAELGIAEGTVIRTVTIDGVPHAVTRNSVLVVSSQPINLAIEKASRHGSTLSVSSS